MRKTILILLLLAVLTLSQDTSATTTVPAETAVADPADDIPEVQFSISTLGLNKVVAFVGDLIDNLLTGIEIPIPIDIDTVMFKGLFTAKVNNVKLASHDIPWNNRGVTINANGKNRFQLSLQNLSFNVTGYEHITIFQILDMTNNFQFNITGVNLIASIIFTPSTDPNTVGFTAQLAPLSPSLTIGSMTLTLQNSTVWNAIFQPVIFLLEQVIPLAFNTYLPKIINNELTKFCSKPWTPQMHIGKYKYQFDINFPGGILQTNADIRVPINIKSIQNLDIAGDVAPVGQKVILPSYYFTNHTDRYDLQVLVGTGLENQIIWTVGDSYVAQISMNSTTPIMGNIPVPLNIKGMQAILPGLYTEYVVKQGLSDQNGIYIVLTVIPQTPDVRLVAGRLIGTVKTSLEFLVDLDEDEYPVEKIADCNCSSALKIEADIYFALDIYTPGQFMVGMNLSNLEIVSATKTAGEVTFDGAVFTAGSSALLSGIVTNINSQYSQGFTIPYVSMATFLEGITLLFDQGYILVDIAINPNN